MSRHVAPSILLALCFAIGCGGSARSTRTAEAASTPPPSGPLAPLRPAGAEPLLAELSADPSDGAAHARAATFYSATSASGMAVLWGLTWGALGSDDADHEAVAVAIMRAFREHITMQRPGTLSTSLAPGSTPVIASEGVMRAPVAHLFELRVGAPAAMAWQGGEWSLVEAAQVLRGLAQGFGPGTAGLESHTELLSWLARAESAGQLEPFTMWLVGPAFPEEAAAYESTHASELAALQQWLASNRFVPSHAVLPDDLVAFP